MDELRSWRGVAFTGLCLALALSWGGGLRAQESDHLALKAEITRLQKAGKYADALPLAERFAAMAKARHGEVSGEHAQALETLAQVYYAQLRYAEAEITYKRVLTIRENVFGPADERVLSILDSLASLYQLTNRPQLAEPLLRRALAGRERLWGANDPKLAETLGALAQALTPLKRYGEAERLLRRALGLFGRPEQHVEQTAKLFGALAQIERDQGRLADAASTLERALALHGDAIKRDSSNSAKQMARLIAMMELGVVYQHLNRFDDAGKLSDQALAILEKLLGPDHPNVASALEAAASIRGYQGRYAEAETLRKRAIAINESAYGKEHINVALSLQGLGNVYRLQGRLDEAFPLLSRALALAEKSLGPEHPSLAPYLIEVGNLHKTLNRYDEAEPLYRRALVNLEKAQGADPLVSGLQTIFALQSLAFLYQSRGRLDEARPFLERALAAGERLLGPEHVMTGAMLSSLAVLLLDQNRVDEAERLYRRALAISAKASREDVGYANNVAGLAIVHSKKKDWAKAYELLRTASDIYIVADQRASAKSAAASEGAQGQSARRADIFLLQALAAYRAASTDTASQDILRDEAFQIAQRAHNSRAAAALGQMAARFSTGAGPLGALVRERQDLANEWRAVDARLTAAYSAAPSERNEAAEAELRKRLDDIAARLDAIDARFAKDFPDYAALSNPQPLSIEEAQRLLGEDEALVFIATRPKESLAWIIGKDGARWAEIPLGEDGLAREVAALRCGLDEAAWEGPGATSCQALLKRTHADGGPLPFDLSRANALYNALFSPFRDLIEGKRLMIAASGPLAILPFAALVTEKPRAAIPSNPSDYATASWLAKRHALTALPSIASLRSLRAAAAPSAAETPFIGFGNPLLAGADGKNRLAWAKQSCPQEAVPLPARVASKAAPDNAATLFRGKIADVSALRRQEPLPETADELCAVARELGADVREVHLGARATESAVKALDASGRLASYGIVHFATHGLLAAETESVGSRAEPSLLLTPPEAPSETDDGLLTASEVAQLKLDAEWVVLSACNTAAGAKSEGEALSGLARAFFYAGARTLLVSQWYIESAAAVKLVTGAVAELKRDPAIGRAEALRRAMLAFMADKSRPAAWTPAAHPAVWAPFVVVGEGGTVQAE